MTEAPKIIMIISKEDIINHMKNEKAELTLYGCPSGKTYSNCHGS